MNDDIWHEDEETYWGCALPTPIQGWTLAASTYDGIPMWEPRWRAIGNTVSALAMFYELPGHKPDWASLLKGLTRLHVLAEETIGSPPLQNFRDFLEIGDYFLTFTSRNEQGERNLLYIIKDKPDETNPLIGEFEELARRLRDYPPLRPYVQYM